MVGVVVAAHGRMAEALVATAEGIAGKLDRVAVVNVSPCDGLESGRKQIAEAIGQVDEGDGVLLLVDMIGGTPSNCCLTQLESGQLEVVTGVNLPMLLKLATSRTPGITLRETAEAVLAYGQKNVLLASDLLRARCSAARP